VNEALIKLEASATIASASKAQLLITPEMYLTGYNIGVAKVRELAEPRDGSMLTSVAEIARRHKIAILVGFPELDADGSIYNAVAFIDEQGALLNLYRKTHLYGDVDRQQFSAGSCLDTPFQYHGWSLATAICYDIEFPEVARHYAQLGVDALLVPTANMIPFDSVATRLVPARAEENGLYVAYANYTGSEGEFKYCGLSCLCGPDGEDIARAGRESELIFGEISPQTLQARRELSPYLQGIRPELY
jgi:predicted amidohydrolase